MSIIYVLSVAPHAGKTAAVLGLGEFLKEKGVPFTYRRPLGGRPVEARGSITDGDALFVSRTLGLEIPPEELTGIVLSQEFVVEALQEGKGSLTERVVSLVRRAGESGKRVLLHGYGGFYAGYFLGLSAPHLLREIPCRVLLVMRYEGLESLDLLLKVLEDLGGNRVALLVNALTPELSEEYQGFIKPFIQRQGVKVLGEIPYDAVLAGVSVRELTEVLQARVLFPFEGDPLVEDFLIGGMQVDQAIRYFRRSRNFGVIVGGDRSDIQLAALETGARCLLLTGGLYPNEIILSRAEEAGVPVLVVEGDTYSVARRVERLSAEAPLRHPQKVKQARDLFVQHLAEDLLSEFLEI
ncbi:DRTGG domain-containing protein [Thermosulfurimonas sp.]|uniref:DRTGG domain-containing protein n=1 Tax=Thermosulfurimonas sp. TaxID=2080236 RepID=UPI0025F65C57|nr:DRTGG domain-containing protein [Thermosulfurimonas sp.]